jgi:hypothetical protein
MHGLTLNARFAAPLCSFQFRQAVEHRRRNEIVHKLTRGFAKLHPESLCDVVISHLSLSMQWVD